MRGGAFQCLLLLTLSINVCFPFSLAALFASATFTVNPTKTPFKSSLKKYPSMWRMIGRGLLFCGAMLTRTSDSRKYNKIHTMEDAVVKRDMGLAVLEVEHPIVKVSEADETKTCVCLSDQLLKCVFSGGEHWLSNVVDQRHRRSELADGGGCLWREF